ncbi:hypothetical protein BOX15_Mlig023007g1 [Macrostomum lignano]|uniref:PPM-type phosphatase domain-containing protein n=2 Tax=Macrostomum lignano TaxID=282301 RepID=A0A267FUD5_9PLAT|nr:hypothetical protein BOX15_Mlig023007g1 [Macrostomum lignano]
MLRRLSGAIRSGLAELDRSEDEAVEAGSSASGPRYAYSRPDFLSLSLEPDEVTGLAGYNVSRPILVAGDKCPLPGMSGYAETINGGKSQRNEDQAQACQFWLSPPNSPAAGGQEPRPDAIMYSNFICTFEDCRAAEAARPVGSTLVTYFALFDGHAGDGASTYARHRLHLHIRDRLQQMHPFLLSALSGSNSTTAKAENSSIGVDDLVTGALENAFITMDQEIGKNRVAHKIKGGCTALVTVFLLGRAYVASAGDSRAVLCRGGQAPGRQLTEDQTPYNDRQRLQTIAANHPRLAQGEFSPLQFAKRLGRRDLGRRVLCRSAFVQGWFLKTVSEEDLLFPLITGDSKKSRLLATIGVARGFGDHDLLVSDSSIAVKPFLSCVPQVVPLHDCIGADDFVVMATDGLWDVLSNEAADAVVKDAVSQSTSNRCVIAAQALVGAARGTWQRGSQTPDSRQSGGFWRLTISDATAAPDDSQAKEAANGTAKEPPASLDDISCFVIPLGWLSKPPTPAEVPSADGDN